MNIGQGWKKHSTFNIEHSTLNGCTSIGGDIQAPLPVDRLRRSVAQVSKPAVSPTSKSAGSRDSNGLQVWKPAIQQTWKSALR
jgi:hypothetical protein